MWRNRSEMLRREDVRMSGLDGELYGAKQSRDVSIVVFISTDRNYFPCLSSSTSSLRRNNKTRRPKMTFLTSEIALIYSRVGLCYTSFACLQTRSCPTCLHPSQLFTGAFYHLWSLSPTFSFDVRIKRCIRVFNEKRGERRLNVSKVPAYALLPIM